MSREIWTHHCNSRLHRHKGGDGWSTGWPGTIDCPSSFLPVEVGRFSKGPKLPPTTSLTPLLPPSDTALRVYDEEQGSVSLKKCNKKKLHIHREVFRVGQGTLNPSKIKVIT